MQTTGADRNDDDRKHPAVFPCYYESTYNDKLKYCDFGLMALPVEPYKKGEKYTTDEIVDHIKFLPKKSNERATSINTIVEGGQAQIGRTKIFEYLKKVESTVFADAETMRKSEKPMAASLLGIQYQGCGIDFGMGNKGLKWRGSMYRFEVISSQIQWKEARE